MKFRNKKVLVYGMSLSGEWVAKLLHKHKAKAFLFDDDLKNLKTNKFKNCFLVQQVDDSLMMHFDMVLVSPSIPLESPVLALARANHVPIMSEIEFASQFAKEVVAITGTNGKTTTVQLVTAMLNKKKPAIACGNIGYPMSRAVIHNKRELKVAEVSSFMLEHCDTFSPHVATVLNIAPDHLIRHKTMEAYADLKKSIFKNITQNDYAVVNLDDEISTNLICHIVTYSYNKPADVYVKNGNIYLRDEKIIPLNKLKLKGKHNVYNVMCAICFAFIYKVKPSKIREALEEFSLDSFRIESVGRVNGINFVNDSKSTNIASTLASVSTVKGAIILLLGGSNKNLDYEELFSGLSKRVKHIVSFGETAEEMKKCNAERFKFEVCETLDEAFNFATQIAKKNDTILLSPATASYDQFSSYVERGRAFNEKVREYATQNSKK